MKEKMVKNEPLFLKLYGSGKLVDFTAETFFWRYAHTNCTSYHRIFGKNPKCKEGSNTMCQQIKLLCDCIGKTIQNPQGIMNYIDQKLSDAGSKVKESGEVAFDLEHRTRYDLYTISDSKDMFGAMAGYLEKSGKVLAKNDWTAQAKVMKDLEKKLDVKKQEKLKEYYDKFS